MIVIVGLGNPGKKHEDTRHNSGFMFVDQLREFWGWDRQYDVGNWETSRKYNADICEIRSGSEKKALLVKPRTFMNLSGEAVSKIVNMYKLDVEKDLVLVHDDLDIKSGEFKAQKEVSPKQHNGVSNVEDRLGKRDFLRIRIGVDGREKVSDIPGEDYVLQKMGKDELEQLSSTINLAIKKLRGILSL